MKPGSKKSKPEQKAPTGPRWQDVTPSDLVEEIVHSRCPDPFAVLGAHQIPEDGTGGVVVRAFHPEALEVTLLILDPGGRVEAESAMERIHADGFFQLFTPGRGQVFDYRLRLSFDDGSTRTIRDPYCFLPVLGTLDRYLFNQGNHLKIYDKLGAHLMEIGGEPGVHFAVWAPSARRVSVIGGFNQWDGRRHPMRSLGVSGIWELFIPGLQHGQDYKFEVKTADGRLLEKSDPYANHCREHGEGRPSLVWDLDRYQWGDGEWMAGRAGRQFDQPISIYEVHLGSWRRMTEEGNRSLSYREHAELLVDYVAEMGFTHVQLLPVAEHPFGGSWGYQVTQYYAPNSRFGGPEDLMHLVDRFHQRGIGVYLDWVPAHFPTDGHSLARFDGSALYEHDDPRQGEHPDWGTLIFNYGRHEVRNFLTANALFWLDRYHVDGLRVDAVASMLYLDYSRRDGEWIANRYGGRENLDAIEFLKQMNISVFEHHPGTVTIAEESTAWPGVSRPVHLGGLGFGMKWNMGWMHDMLKYMAEDPVYRKYHHSSLTFALLYAFHENFILPLSHDEVVYGKRSLLEKMPGDPWQKKANLRLLYGYMFGQPGKKLLFMGGEFGQRNEWDHQKSLDWHLLEQPGHAGIRHYLRDLNHLYRGEPAMWEKDFYSDGFQWIDLHNWEESVVAFLRRGVNPEDFLVFIYNFTPVPRSAYRIGVPRGGGYAEVLNSDAEIYGGSNMGNLGQIEAEALPWDGMSHSISITLPPLAAVVFKPL